MGKIKSFYQSAKVKLKKLKKEVVVIENNEEPPNEPKIVVSKTKTVKDFEQVSITATLDPKTWSNKSDTESFEKQKTLKKIFPTNKKTAPPGNRKSFPPIRIISSSSSFSSSVESLNVSAKTSGLSEQSKASSGLSTEAETCNEAAKTEKIVVFGNFINVSF